jgi:hypothetical protein
MIACLIENGLLCAFYQDIGVAATVLWLSGSRCWHLRPSASYLLGSQLQVLLGLACVNVGCARCTGLCVKVGV